LDFTREQNADSQLCASVDKILVRQNHSDLASQSLSSSSSRKTEPYDQYLADVEYAATVATDRYDYVSMLGAIEAAAVADQGMYSDTLDLELVCAVTSTAAESAAYADDEVESWGELYDPCHSQIIRDPGCPELYSVNLLRTDRAVGGIGTTDLARWARAGWHILIADVGGAIGGGLVARVARIIVPETAIIAAAVASGGAAAVEIVDYFYQ
jgi:hypothetical protein